MTNQIRPDQNPNSSDICFKSDLSCQNIYLSGFPSVQTELGDCSNIVHKEVKNMTNHQSKFRIFSMIITFPMIFTASINPVLSLGLSRQLEIGIEQSSWLVNSLVSSRNNVLNRSADNKPEKFLTSSYYSKDCRRRNVCDD